MTDQATGGQRADGAPIALRVLAYVADLCLASTVVAIALIINVLAGVEKGQYFLGGGVIVAIIISIVLHGAFGASPGKMLAGLTVVDADTRRALGYPASAIRSVVFNVLAPLVYLPAWSILADGGRRGIHEKASKTTVVDGADVVAEEPRPQPATPSGPLGGLVAGDAAEDSALQRIPTPLPADAAPTDALTDDADGEPRERLQPPSLPPLPDDVPGLRPVPPRFGPPLADGEESTAAPAAAFAQPPQAPVAPPVPPRPAQPLPPRQGPPQGQAPQGQPQPPRQGPPPQAAPPRPAGPAPQVPPQQRPSAPSPLQTAGSAGARPAGGAPIVLRFDDGHSVDVRGDGIIGREPVIPPGADASKVTKYVLVDDTASVSKTHLLFGLTRGELWVEDVGSTNGSAIAYEDSWTELTKGVRYAVEKGSVVHMGQRSFKVLGG